jgi:hypothetical protein
VYFEFVFLKKQPMSTQSPLHVIMLGEGINHNSDLSRTQTDSPLRPRTVFVEAAPEAAPPKVAPAPRPASAVIHRYKNIAAIREKNRSALDRSGLKPSLYLEIKSPTREVQGGIAISSPKDFQFVPETFVNNISKATSPSGSSGPPVGAHTAGLYTKLRLEAQRSIPRGALSVTHMLKDIGSSSDKKVSTRNHIKNNTETFNNRRVSFGNEEIFQESLTIGIDSYKLEPDMYVIEESLAILIDIDSSGTVILDALNELIEAIEVDTEPSMSKTLFEAGAVKVLVELLPRTISNVEVQCLSCQLLKYILTNYTNATDTFISLGGLPHLLRATDISSKGIKYFI